MKLLALILLIPILGYSQSIKKNIYVRTGETTEYRRADHGPSFNVNNMFIQPSSQLVVSGVHIYVYGDIRAFKKNTVTFKFFKGGKIYYHGKCNIKHPNFIAMKDVPRKHKLVRL